MAGGISMPKDLSVASKTKGVNVNILAADGPENLRAHFGHGKA
jgi:hypothetical protein